MYTGNLTSELMEKAKACSTADELLTLAKEEGVELTDEQLEAVAGGGIWSCEDHESCDEFSCDSLCWSHYRII